MFLIFIKNTFACLIAVLKMGCIRLHKHMVSIMIRTFQECEFKLHVQVARSKQTHSRRSLTPGGYITVKTPVIVLKIND